MYEKNPQRIINRYVEDLLLCMYECISAGLCRQRMEYVKAYGREKYEEGRKNYFFDNRALLILIIPLVIEQLLAVLVGMSCIMQIFIC